MPMPRALQWALMESVLGANPAVYMYSMGAGFAQIMYNQATEEQMKWAGPGRRARWTSTMVLTSPTPVPTSAQAARRPSSSPTARGTWDGVKRFITSGDADDLGENILHLVLARPEGAGPGTKGLSLFFVPKYHFDFETVSRRAQRRLRHQPRAQDGLKVSASVSCRSASTAPRRRLARRRGAQRHRADVRGHRTGANDGGHQGHRHAVDRLLNALEYAKSRIQGADLTQMTDKTAPRVSITHHPTSVGR